MKLFSMLVLCSVLSGCVVVGGEIHPLVEVQHMSHVSQHLGSGGQPCAPHCGFNALLVGARVHTDYGVQLDVLEGYSANRYDGTHELFQARLQWEVK